MVLVCHKVVPPLLYDWISLLLFAPLRSLLDCHENYRFKFAFNALMHSHVVLKKQIVLLVESVDKLPNNLIRHLIHSANKKKCVHLIHFGKVPRRMRLLLRPKQRNIIWLVPPNIFTKKKDTTCESIYRIYNFSYLVSIKDALFILFTHML